MTNVVAHVGKLVVTTPSDREIAMTREFAAPRALVFDAWTRPELIKRWLGVRAGWTMPVCEVDLRVGGAYRFLWRQTGGAEMGMRGVYLEVVRPERIVATEVFGQAWYEGDAVDTMTFVERGGRTTLTTSVRYDSRATRDAVLESPMATGVAEGYDVLEQMLPTLR